MICDHASNAIPAALNNLGLEEGQMEDHIAWDIGAANVTRHLARKLDATAFLNNYSRLLIDANRQPGDPSSIPEISDETQIPGNHGLNEDQQIQRSETFFWPYHHAISDGIAHLWRRGTAPALFSVHTFTPSMNGADRPWQISVLWNRDPRMAKPLIERLGLRRPDSTIGDNQPYSGKDVAYSLDLHAGAAGLAHAAVEIRQDLVHTDGQAEDWADLLAECLGEILRLPGLHDVKHY
ncbi:MAG: N-formylglutamate amidohydrolase [Rhodospirillales bacterium]|nr:N-formylglutamate amidohydrolase [Rhodospirillales bacterium]